MNIISTFPFAEAHELEVLLIKFHVENNGVTEWVINENDYTWMGKYKGFHLKELLDTDTRFDAFRHKITIIEKSVTREVKQENDAIIGIGHEQRDFGTSYILEKYWDKDNWVIHADVDEAYDFTGSERTEIIFDSLKKYPDKCVWFPTRKYWYDFDNYGFTYHFHAVIPVHIIRNAGRMMGSITPHNSVKVLNSYDGEFAIFEYTFCFSKEAIMRKLDTWGHFPYSEENLDLALKCNKWMRKNTDKPSPPPGQPTDNEPLNHWFEKIEINETNTPKYVLDNLESLRTNNVDPNYLENRKKYFSELFA